MNKIEEFYFFKKSRKNIKSCYLKELLCWADPFVFKNKMIYNIWLNSCKKEGWKKINCFELIPHKCIFYI